MVPQQPSERSEFPVRPPKSGVMHERWPTNDRTWRILLRTGPIKKFAGRILLRPPASESVRCSRPKFGGRKRSQSGAGRFPCPN
jgi:hypothetical protein